MRKHLLGLMLIAGLAGCTSESDSDLTGVASNKAVGVIDGATVPTGTSLAARRGSATSFASLPDRGELFAYDPTREVRRSGAYSYYPVSLSEAHAMNAIAREEMLIRLPGGEALNLKYDRHEEQPDGNWTWIGHDAEGNTAVLTFGEKAVFGMISTGDGYFRVRTERGAAWVVATDHSRVVSGGGLREGGPDYLLPAERGVMASLKSAGLAKAAASKATGSTKAAAVVDVLIGYSNGLAATYGGQAQAATFVASLVSLSNVAYERSGVSMRLRLVHAMQVNYADTSDNQDALQQLTGYDANTQQPIPVNSAFNGLRAARDEYGADLVAFVRAYREPEQDGCGIAWLLGMNQSGISAADDADFGYAVVSDGEDRDESDSNTYFCSDFSLAHELGHLMGQAHNEEDADDAGAHVYSYGFREASATGFHTVMAYPSGGSQIEIANFSNPAVSAWGRPTGVSNEADNARSMNITMPIVSTFRDTVVPLAGLKNDFNADGRSDIYWTTSDGRSSIWLSANSATAQVVTPVGNSTWQVAGLGDFNGDGKSDVLWHRSMSGESVIWLSANSATRQAVTKLGLPGQLKVAGIGDFNGDGRDDILWHRESNGSSTIWLSGNSNTPQAVSTLGLPGQLKVVGIGDFNGDGRDDILWHRSSNGTSTIWLSGNSRTSQAVTTIGLPGQLKVAGVGDFNGDGRDDILWHRASNGTSVIWRSGNSNTPQSVTTIGLPGQLQVASVADFNGDGRDDILWHRSSNRSSVIWLSANSTTPQAVTTMSRAGWRIVP